MTKKGQHLNGYLLTTDFSTVGGGMCRWAFCHASGKEYFIKEFLNPKFPVDGSPGSEKLKEEKRKDCTRFEDHQTRMMNCMRPLVSYGGNLVGPINFFRAGSLYYKVTEKVDVVTISPMEISKLPWDDKLLILKTISHSIGILHRMNIVHGDLKPDNILIKKTDTGKYVTKLIDMDNSYFSGDAPEISEETDIVGTPNYYSPELGDYVMKQSEICRLKLTTASDIYALGIIFSQYVTGEMPKVTEKSKYPWESTLEGMPLNCGLDEFPKNFQNLIDQMLLLDPTKRPLGVSLLNELKSLEYKESVKYELPIYTGKSRLKGTGIKLTSSPAEESTSKLSPESTKPYIGPSRLKGTFKK